MPAGYPDGTIVQCNFPESDQDPLSQAASGNYGGIMMFNVRKASNVNPLPVFQKIAEGAFGATVTYTGTEYSQDWTFNPAG
ncbi:MAG: hypothetical protein ACLTZY_03425 [Alistipes indistinctus]